jgi:hypothetical protein
MIFVIGVGYELRVKTFSVDPTPRTPSIGRIHQNRSLTISREILPHMILSALAGIQPKPPSSNTAPHRQSGDTRPPGGYRPLEQPWKEGVIEIEKRDGDQSQQVVSRSIWRAFMSRN